MTDTATDNPSPLAPVDLASIPERTEHDSFTKFNVAASVSTVFITAALETTVFHEQGMHILYASLTTLLGSAFAGSILGANYDRRRREAVEAEIRSTSEYRNYVEAAEFVEALEWLANNRTEVKPFFEKQRAKYPDVSQQIMDRLEEQTVSVANDLDKSLTMAGLAQQVAQEAFSVKRDEILKTRENALRPSVRERVMVGAIQAGAAAAAFVFWRFTGHQPG